MAYHNFFVRIDSNSGIIFGFASLYDKLIDKKL